MEPILARIVAGAQSMDQSLPTWARRNNPIVRRQLGIYWKTLPLELAFWLRIVGIESIGLLLAVAFPMIYSLVMPIVTVSVIMLPLVVGLYAQILYNVLIESMNAIIDEKRNNTLDLLIVTPLPFRHILFSKVAASLWRQLDNLNLVIAGHVLLSLPFIVLQYASGFNMTQSSLGMAVVIIAALVSYFFRLLLEPAMLGALGVLFGALVTPRILSLIVGTAITVSYFLFINLLRVLPMDLPVRLFVELILPLILPIAITWAALTAAAYALRRD